MKSQEQEVLTWLRKHRSIDPLTAWKRLGVYRLGARIYDLRKRGHDITTTLRKTKGGSRVAVYRLAASAR